jgi:hypothetical protein
MNWEACCRMKSRCHLKHSVAVCMVWLRVTIKTQQSLLTREKPICKPQKHTTILLFIVYNSNNLVRNIWREEYTCGHILLNILQTVTCLFTHLCTHESQMPFHMFIYCSSCKIIQQKPYFMICMLYTTFKICSNCSQNEHTDRSYTSCSIWTLVLQFYKHTIQYMNHQVRR